MTLYALDCAMGHAMAHAYIGIELLCTCCITGSGEAGIRAQEMLAQDEIESAI